MVAPGGAVGENPPVRDHDGGDPGAQVRVWMPHILMLAALVGAVWLLVDVVAPMFEPILLAAALAILTSPVLCDPLNDRMARRFPKLRPSIRHKIAGLAATIALVLLALTPIFLVILGQADNLGELAEKIRGLAMREPETIQSITDSLVAQVREIKHHYEKLPIDPERVGSAVKEFLSDTKDVNSAFISFFLAGTGTVAQVALALVSLAYFYIDGPRLVAGLLEYSPLTEVQRNRLVEQHKRVVLRLLSDTVATAVVKGIVLGGIVYIVDQLLGSGSLPFLPIAIVAALITLLPLVGVTMVWLPFAGLAWTQGNRIGAGTLAVLCYGSNFLLDHYGDKLGSKLHARTDWLGFLLFLGVIGGLLSHGPKGLIIGPFAVVMVITIFRAWVPLYVDEPADAATEDGSGA